MKPNLQKIFYSLLLLLVNVLTFAQSVPPPPDQSESGGIGNQSKVPIDDYVFILLIVGVLFIVVNYYRTLKKRTI